MGNILGLSGGTLLLIVVPLGCVVLAFWFLIWEAQKKSRRPFSGHPLRPPGESVRQKVDVLNEQLLLRLMMLSVAEVYRRLDGKGITPVNYNTFTGRIKGY